MFNRWFLRMFLSFIFLTGIAVVSPWNSAQASVSWDSKISGGRIDRGGPLFQTADGGYVAFSRTSSFGVNAYDFDVALIKFDPLGNVEWQKTYGNDLRNWATSFEATSDGGFLIAGGGWLIKVNYAGAIQWQKAFQNGGHSIDIRSAKEAPDGGFVLLVNDGVPQGYQIRYSLSVIKVDHNGNSEWQKSYGVGGGADILPLPDGGYLVEKGINLPGETSQKLLVFKLNPTGDVIWQRVFGSDTGNFYAGNIYGAPSRDKDGNYLVFGIITYSAQSYQGHPVRLKLDAQGNILGSKRYVGLSRTSLQLHIFGTEDGGYLLSGTHAPASPYMLRLTENGDVSFAIDNSVGNRYVNENAIETRDGGLLVSMYTYDQYRQDGTLRLIKWTNDLTSCSLPKKLISISITENILSTFEAPAVGITNVNYAVIDNDFFEASVGFNVAHRCISAVPQVGVDASALSGGFGPVEVGTSAPGIMFVVNSGAADLTVNSINLVGGDVDQFAINSQCSTIFPNGACSVDVTFTPTSLGTKQASVIILSNDPNHPEFKVPIYGTGVDTTPPVIQLNGASEITLEAGSPYVELSSTASDNYDGDLTSDVVIAGQVNTSITGTYVVTYNVVDSSGNRASEVIRTISVVDTKPPTVNLSVTPTVLWPPNHKMIEVKINGGATDLGSGVAIVEIVVTDEYGQYNMVVPGFGASIFLEASRKGNDKDGRQYVIQVAVTDRVGNVATATNFVVVPHDMAD